MVVSSFFTRLQRTLKFAKQAASQSAIPGLVIVGVARDNPFGHTGIWSSMLGRWFGVIKVRTSITDGEFALIDTHDLGQLISCEEVLIERAYDLSVVPFRPDLIVDCGAHTGLFSLIAGLRYSSAEMIAFEPNPRNFCMAQQQLARFGTRIRLVEAAVSTENGEAWFRSEESNTGFITDTCYGHEQRVRLVNLLDEAPNWSGRRLLLKMDIEGGEQEVLPHVIHSLSLPSQCALFFEIHGGQSAWHELSNLASRAGFQVHQTRKRDPFADGFALRI
jgi:FkbM family methyltransferase